MFLHLIAFPFHLFLGILECWEIVVEALEHVEVCLYIKPYSLSWVAWFLSGPLSHTHTLHSYVGQARDSIFVNWRSLVFLFLRSGRLPLEEERCEVCSALRVYLQVLCCFISIFFFFFSRCFISITSPLLLLQLRGPKIKKKPRGGSPIILINQQL